MEQQTDVSLSPFLSLQNQSIIFFKSLVIDELSYKQMRSQNNQFDRFGQLADQFSKQVTFPDFNYSHQGSSLQEDTQLTPSNSDQMSCLTYMIFEWAT